MGGNVRCRQWPRYGQNDRNQCGLSKERRACVLYRKSQLTLVGYADADVQVIDATKAERSAAVKSGCGGGIRFVFGLRACVCMFGHDI